MSMLAGELDLQGGDYRNVLISYMKTDMETCGLCNKCIL
jgi:hypothetical protein